MKQRSFVVVILFIVGGLVFLPSCNNGINLPNRPMGLTSTFTSTPTNTAGTLTPTPTGSATSTTTATLTLTGSSTFTPTPTSTVTSTVTGSPTRTFTPFCSCTATMTLTFTPTSTPTGSATSTPTAIATLTGSPTWTSTPQVCAPLLGGVAAGVSIMNYGQWHLYVIRAQADWDAYLGTTGATPPVNFSNQMLLVVNWGTEYCQPGVGQPSLGRVWEYNITSVCVNASSIEVRVPRGSRWTRGAS